MEALMEKSLPSGSSERDVTGGSFVERCEFENDRLSFGEKDTNKKGELVGWSWRRSFSGSCTVSSAADMTISRSCRCGLSVPVMFWTTVCLILLARGVNSVSKDQSRFTRSPKFEQDAGDVQGGFNVQETFNVMQFLRELIQRQQQKANQQSLQVYNNGEDMSEREIDWRKVPLPLLYQIRSIINDGSKEEEKRGSYMSLCHFKICNLG